MLLCLYSDDAVICSLHCLIKRTKRLAMATRLTMIAHPPLTFQITVGMIPMMVSSMEYRTYYTFGGYVWSLCLAF